jgi:predicted acetylornithine/succinylornithine family transaminase
MSRSTQELLAIADRTNSTTYAPARFVLDRGEGVRLYDLDGNEYLDFVAGIAVNALGHGHPELTRAIQEQAAKLLHVSNMFVNEPQIELMEYLTEHSFADRVFLCNSGTEATEAGMKLARRWQKTVGQAPQRTDVLSMKKSFHGRTMASLTATGQPKYHKGFEPLVPGHRYAEFNDLDSVAAAIGPNTAAVIMEPVQGEGGIRPSSPEFIEGVRELCDNEGVLLIFDEVQAGVGRTGSLFAYQGYGVAPDIICLAKGLGGGVPVGAMMATERVYSGFERGSHASTFGGNPLASTAALTVLRIIERDQILENVSARGEQLRAGLRELAQRYDVIREVRGRGLMVGAECGDEAGAIALACRDEGLLINTAGGNTLRFVPPLVVTEADVDEALERVERGLARWQAAQAA